VFVSFGFAFAFAFVLWLIYRCHLLFLRRQSDMPTSTSPWLQMVLDGVVHGWGDKYGPILHGLGLNSPDELIDFTDGEVKEVLLEPLQLAGAPARHIARILKALKQQHRSSTVTNNVDDLVNPVVNADPAITTNRVDNQETIENYVEDVIATTNRVEYRETIDDVPSMMLQMSLVIWMTML
jgi:hypothetical protein